MANCPFASGKEIMVACRQTACALWNATESKCYLASYCGGIKSVQRGEKDCTAAVSFDVTISAVDIDKSFVLCSWRSSVTTYIPSIYLLNSTTLRIEFGVDPGAKHIYVRWEVVEFL